MKQFESPLYFWQLATVGAALLAGASLTACNLEFRKEKDGGRLQSQVTADYSSIQQNIVNSRCIACHSSPSGPHGIDLSSYESIVNSAVFPPLIVPGSPEQSSLYTSIIAGRMPKGAPRLSDGAIGALYEWIKNGAREIEDPSGNPSPLPDEPGDEPGDGEEPGDEPSDEPGEASVEPCDRKPKRNEPGILKCS